MLENNKIALTIDVEDWYHTPAVSGSDFSCYKDVDDFMAKWQGRYDYLSEPTIRTLRILEEFRLKATFFIVADIINLYPGLVDKILNAGHEIACHGLHHALKINSKTKLPVFSKLEFEHRTGVAKEMLERFSGKSVIGYRAPGAYFGNYMFESLINLGFKYDSSISPNSLYNKTDFNIRNITSAPYMVRSETNELSLIELPWSYNNIGGFKLPTGGGPFLRFMPKSYIIAGLENSLKRGHTVLYFHPIDISQERLPNLASSNSQRPFFFKTSGTKTESKLRGILSQLNTYFVTCDNLIKIL